MLELYHGTTSVCAQKARLALAEKGLEWQSHLMTLNGDQLDPAYLKLNPNGVVPTLVNDGNVIIESTVIMHYLDDTSRALPSGGSASKSAPLMKRRSRSGCDGRTSHATRRSPTPGSTYARTSRKRPEKESEIWW